MTDPSQQSLGSKVAIGAGWVISWRFSTRGLGFLSMIVLARLLVPADFGLVAVAWAFLAALEALTAIGMAEAILRAPKPGRDTYDTAFTLGLIRAAATALLIVAASSPMATFFSDPRLADILVVLGSLTFLGALANIGTVDFRRNLDFRKEFLFQIVPRLISVLTTVLVAILTRSYWALIIGAAANSVLTLAMSYVLHPFRPRLALGAWRELVGFSAWSWAGSVCSFIRDRSDALIIGRMLGPTSVGFFTVANELATMPTTELISPISRALFPAFAAARNAGYEMGRLAVQTLGVLLAISVPAAVGVAAVAAPMVEVALGAKWMSSAPLVAILALGASISPFMVVIGFAMVIVGIYSVNVAVAAATATLRIAGLFFAVRHFGLVGAAWVIAATAMLEAAAFVWVARRWLGVPVISVLAVAWRTAAAAGTMALALYVAQLGWGLSSYGAGATLALAVPLGAAAHMGAVLCLWMLSGRPEGPETRILGLIQETVRRATGSGARA